MNIVITGGAGFLGARLARALLELPGLSLAGNTPRHSATSAADTRRASPDNTPGPFANFSIKREPYPADRRNARRTSFPNATIVWPLAEVADRLYPISHLARELQPLKRRFSLRMPPIQRS